MEFLCFIRKRKMRRAHTSYWLLEQKVKNLQAFSEKTVDKRKKNDMIIMTASTNSLSVESAESFALEIARISSHKFFVQGQPSGRVFALNDERSSCAPRTMSDRSTLMKAERRGL